jgi:hypothetical protein
MNTRSLPLSFTFGLALLCAVPVAAQPEPTAAPAPTEADRDVARPTEEARPDKPRHHRRDEDDVRVGSGVTVAAGETHEGKIVVIGGSVAVAGRQHGDVVVMGGTLDISGKVEGKVVVMGGSMSLGSAATVEDDVVVMGGVLHKAEGASIGGKTVEMGRAGMLAHALPFAGMGLGMGLFTLSLVAWLKTATLTLLLTVVIAAVVPVRVEAAAGILRERWLACLGWGLAAFVAAWPLTLLLCITCVGAIVPYALYQAAKYFGLAALFAVVGQALGRTGMHRDLSLMPALLVGFMALSLIGLLAPVWLIYGWIAVGCAIETKLGTRAPYRPVLPEPSMVPVPPAPERGEGG